MVTSVKSVPQSRSFRLDINGLRAWAVVAVVLYHFGLLPGGFSGVDVFFVISGFLMSGIVLGGLESESFSIWRFYWARARRIVPALAVLCAAVLLVGWHLLMTTEYQMLGRHVRDSLFFNSNLQYLSESGYFDSSSHEKWLLHTWSLSVEWQFYLIFPIFLLTIGKLSNSSRLFAPAIWVLLLASFAWGIFLLGNQPVAAFYKIESRAWEMLAGAAVFVSAKPLSSPALRRLLSWLGLLLIIVSVIIFTPQSSWPGWGALAPVLGAVLVLWARDEASLCTSSRLAQWIGERSYSIYLWHWPVFVICAYFKVDDQYFWVSCGIAISFLLGHLSYVWVEEPSRRVLSRKGYELRGFIGLLLLVVAVTVVAQFIRVSGVPGRLPTEVREVDAARFDVNPRRDECQDAKASCIYGGENIRLIVVGDSHADTLVSAVREALRDEDGILYKGESGCLVMTGSRSIKEHEDCELLNRWVFEELPRILPGKPVLLVNALPGYALGVGDSYDNVGRPKVYFHKQHLFSSAEFREEFRRGYVKTACKIAETNPLYVTRPLPDMPGNVPNLLGRAIMRGETVEVFRSIQDYRKRNDFIWDIQDDAARECGIQILDPLPYLCREGRCMGAENGVLYYWDDGHLTQKGSRQLIPLFRKAFGPDSQ